MSLSNSTPPGRLLRLDGGGTMGASMQLPYAHRPRIGVPYRTTNEQLTGKREAYDKYLRAVGAAGGEPVEVSLVLTGFERDRTLRTLDGVVLPGSPADVDPARYLATRSPHCADPDPPREQTDIALLDVAFSAHTPVLAICYGIQNLNVYLGGSLFQDIAAELPGALEHEWKHRDLGFPEPSHTARIDKDSKLGRMAAVMEVEVNSSHHQAVCQPATGLRVVAEAPDSVIEAVEWTRDETWVVGVQWHPERRPGDALARALFGELVAAARAIRANR